MMVFDNRIGTQDQHEVPSDENCNFKINVINQSFKFITIHTKWEFNIGDNSAATLVETSIFN